LPHLVVSVRLVDVEGAEQDYPSFESFVRAHARSLFGTAYLLCGDVGSAEDLVQEALARSFDRWDVVAAARSPVGYVRRILVNRFIDTTRGPRGRVMVVGEVPDTAGGADLADAVVAKDAVRRLLATLEDRQRAVLVLKYLYDWPDDQIADAISCRIATVRSLSRRALLRLRSSIALTDAEIPRD
jgi:RNA polymerase sigma-70 factor (sigma-E family)